MTVMDFIFASCRNLHGQWGENTRGSLVPGLRGSLAINAPGKNQKTKTFFELHPPLLYSLKVDFRMIFRHVIIETCFLHKRLTANGANFSPVPSVYSLMQI